jgi:hypothetical protein
MGALRQAGLGPHPRDGFRLTLRSFCLAAAPRVSISQGQTKNSNIIRRNYLIHTLGMTGMDDIRAESLPELLAILKSANISVPLRAKGRTKERYERWAMGRLLCNLAARNLIGKTEK